MSRRRAGSTASTSNDLLVGQCFPGPDRQADQADAGLRLGTKPNDSRISAGGTGPGELASPRSRRNTTVGSCRRQPRLHLKLSRPLPAVPGGDHDHTTCWATSRDRHRRRDPEPCRLHRARYTGRIRCPPCRHRQIDQPPVQRWLVHERGYFRVSMKPWTPANSGLMIDQNDIQLAASDGPDVILGDHPRQYMRRIRASPGCAEYCTFTLRYLRLLRSFATRGSVAITQRDALRVTRLPSSNEYFHGRQWGPPVAAPRRANCCPEGRTAKLRARISA